MVTGKSFSWGLAPGQTDTERIEIGEKDNLCILTLDEWAVLKQKVLSREI